MQNGRERQVEERIGRVFTESYLRDADYIMPSHHFHPYFELYYVERGACRFFLGDGIYDLHTGDFLLIPPQVLHYTRYLFGPCRRDAVFFRREDIDGETVSLLPGGADFFSEPRILQAAEFSRDQFAALFSRMVAEERIRDRASDALLRLRLRELLLLCSRCCTAAGEAPADIRTTDRQIVRAAKYMAEHYAGHVTAAEIAAAAGFSPNYFSRRFRQATGVGVHEYLVYLRLRQAALELASTGDSVTEIALRCGFSDGNYFKDAFKKRYGMTPSAYRRAPG